MYIGSQYKRKRTEDKELLKKEHIDEVKLYESYLEKGNLFEKDVKKIRNMYEEIFGNDRLANEDKRSLLDELDIILLELQKEYDCEIQGNIKDINLSMENRIGEMEEATLHRKEDVFDFKHIRWNTDAVDREKLILRAKQIYYEYCILLDDSKAELIRLMQQAEKQKTEILLLRN